MLNTLGMKKNIAMLGGSVAALTLTPLIALAAADLDGLLQIILKLFQTAIPVLLAFALLGFMWGGAKLIWSAGNEKKRAEGKNILIWGVIGLFFALSFTGMVQILENTFHLGSVPLVIPSPYIPGGTQPH